MLILTSYLELENDRWMVETSFVFNVNFYYQIGFEKFVDLYIYIVQLTIQNFSIAHKNDKKAKNKNLQLTSNRKM